MQLTVALTPSEEGHHHRLFAFCAVGLDLKCTEAQGPTLLPVLRVDEVIASSR